VKKTTSSCDRCGHVFTRDGHEGEIGLTDCERAPFDLCHGCAALFYAWLGKTWNELHRAKETL